ncbi:hypothetical protein BCR37DRAFT_275249 [Protomyces lactucae-debilis]|uniref:Uncharacterized protein n=1 Tax=Protomyces lactucae-debilis TaxID=2754530 RepID=A0A1Y2FKB1_PROLT|nr:uncharacterized protein BCR37DRAFT_275249 [Protomyces lactucae-debilis]ORY83656.1 hypothetical protein BCR37DRAFT_275249 [Protomyces lactucae-debilis]
MPIQDSLSLDTCRLIAEAVKLGYNRRAVLVLVLSWSSSTSDSSEQVQHVTGIRRQSEQEKRSASDRPCSGFTSTPADLSDMSRNLQKFTKQASAGGFTAEKLFGAIPSLVLWGGAAGAGVLLYGQGVRKLRNDVLESVPILKDYFKSTHEVPASVSDHQC